MICLDTTFLIDLWRHRNHPSHPATALLTQHPTDVFVVPVMAAGEFLEGAAFISEKRFQESLSFLSLFEFGPNTIETAKQYALIVSDLRNRKLLKHKSKADLWIAAWALEHHIRLVTQNVKLFQVILDLQLITY